MLSCFVSDTKDPVIPIVPICKNDFTRWLETQSTRIKNLITVNNFLGELNTFCLLTNQDGNLEKVLLILEDKNDFLAFGILPLKLPMGCYYIDAPDFSSEQREYAAIGWGMGSYQFILYKKPEKTAAQLLCKDGYDLNNITTLVATTFWVRDLINMPAAHLFPENLAKEAENLAKEFQAEFKVIRGEQLQKEFPAVFAVGCGSQHEPLMIDLCYGKADAPKVVLVGKGVCFDSGGLHLKSSAGLLFMNKDMAGAAHVLGLAKLIMTARLPINLRVIIPVVENLISGSSYKTGDIIKTRKGITIEVVNTDAEGRLILADALSYASEWQPKLIIDFATLTGAARVALGSDIAALFTPDDKLAIDIIATTSKEHESAWRMPLYQPYLKSLESKKADFKNASTSSAPTAGAITAALLLQQFIEPNIQWLHLDINAYNTKSQPGKLEGGEMECVKGIFKYLQNVFK